MSKVIVDDTSLSIKYTGYWEKGEDSNSTVHSAWDPNSEAIFSFKGASISLSSYPGLSTKPCLSD